MYFISSIIGCSEICRVTDCFLTWCCHPLQVVSLPDCAPLGTCSLSQTDVNLPSMFHTTHSVACSATMPLIIGTSHWYTRNFHEKKNNQGCADTTLGWFWSSSIYPEERLCLANADGKRLLCRLHPYNLSAPQTVLKRSAGFHRYD